jgi:parallel beta-helix repeat protein
MRISRRSAVSIGVFVVLIVFVVAGLWYESRQVAPGQAPDTAAVNVTNGGDRGPGTLREALFIAASADSETTISIQVPKVTLETSLPPLVSSRGVRLVAGESGSAEIDASALPSGPVLDVVGANVTIDGLRIRNCKAAGILLRAEQFRLQSTTIEGCDVGVDVAENAGQVIIERNRFVRNRVGVRFAASNRNSIVVKNEFGEHRDAGVWAVRGDPDLRGAAISIRDNRFTKERTAIVAANISIAVERNELLDAREAAMQFIGTGAVVRANRVSRGAGMGIVAENSRGAVIENNELDGLTAYGIMVKGSADAVLRGNRVHNSGYGLAFVVGDSRSPSSAIENTIIEPKFNGIDVIGDSPILRGNNVVRPRALALKVVDFDSGSGQKVRSQPFLEGNNFDAKGAIIASGNASPAGNPGLPR